MSDVGALFAFRDQPILLVGKGDNEPRLWLAVPLQDGKTDELVRDNRPTNSLVAVDRLGDGKVGVRVRAIPVLVASASQDQGRIEQLDFRPLGMNFHLKGATLHLARTTFAESTFRQLDVAFAFGGGARVADGV